MGGDLVKAGSAFMDPLTNFTARFTLPGSTPTIEIVTSALGERSELMGAIAYALDSVSLPGDLEGVVLHAVH